MLFNFLPTGALEKCYLCCFLKILSVNLAKLSCISRIFQSHCFVGVTSNHTDRQGLFPYLLVSAYWRYLSVYLHETGDFEDLELQFSSKCGQTVTQCGLAALHTFQSLK